MTICRGQPETLLFPSRVRATAMLPKGNVTLAEIIGGYRGPAGHLGLHRPRRPKNRTHPLNPSLIPLCSSGGIRFALFAGTTSRRSGICVS